MLNNCDPCDEDLFIRLQKYSDKDHVMVLHLKSKKVLKKIVFRVNRDCVHVQNLVSLSISFPREMQNQKNGE